MQTFNPTNLKKTGSKIGAIWEVHRTGPTGGYSGVVSQARVGRGSFHGGQSRIFSYPKPPAPVQWCVSLSENAHVSFLGHAPYL